jgi:UDP-N-acetyl-D-glucosamine dehydrogenase
VQSFDVALIATNHASVNYRELGQWSRCVVDTRNAMAGIPGKVWKA